MTRSPRTRPVLEQLEDRLALAGNVTAALSGQDLFVEGDSLGNELRIAQNASGNVTITGLNGTTINGRASVTFVNPQLIKTEVKLNAGADRLVLAGVPGVTVTNDLNVEMGAGNDILNASNTKIGANFTVLGDGGADRVTVSNLTVGIDAKIDGGQDNLTASLSNSTIGGALDVVGEAGTDTVTLGDLAVGGDVNVDAKGGNDRVTVMNLSAFSLTVATDLGADIVNLTDVTTSEDLKVETGGGNDTVNLTRVSVGKSVSVSTDEGNDTVSVTDVTAAVDAVFVGGAGTDTFDDNGVTAGVILEIKEFELFV